ncbi:MAG: helix-turn-helix transcriptional regulator [Myxococcota bacterium]
MQQSREVVIDGRRYRLVPVEPEPIVGGPHPEPCPELTDREAEVVELVARGYVNKQIAATLDISEHTVSTHLRRIFA